MIDGITLLIDNSSELLEACLDCARKSRFDRYRTADKIQDIFDNLLDDLEEERTALNSQALKHYDGVLYFLLKDLYDKLPPKFWFEVADYYIKKYRDIHGT